jgi:hypothetical protein
MNSALIWSSVLTAAAFGLIYYPAFDRLARGLASQYAKADLGKRLSAAMIDALMVLSAWTLYRPNAALVYLFAGVGYMLLRDSISGRSVGKWCLGLVVIDLTTGRPGGAKQSLLRNAVLVLPGANVVALFLEAASLVRDPQGQRLGDRVAQTQVVDGFGARELAADFLAWWRDFIGTLDGTPRRRRRVPARREAA